MIDLPLIFHLYRGMFAVHLLAKIKVLIVQFGNVLGLHVQITLQCVTHVPVQKHEPVHINLTLNFQELEHVFVEAFNNKIFLY